MFLFGRPKKPAKESNISEEPVIVPYPPALSSDGNSNDSSSRPSQQSLYPLYNNPTPNTGMYKLSTQMKSKVTPLDGVPVTISMGENTVSSSQVMLSDPMSLLNYQFDWNAFSYEFSLEDKIIRDLK